MTLLLRSLPLLALAFLAAGCGTETTTKPSFYENLASPEAKVDGVAAASMISDYRRNNSLGGVEIDPTLTRMAEDHARAMAKLDKVTHDPGGRGVTPPELPVKPRQLVPASGASSFHQRLRREA